MERNFQLANLFNRKERNQKLDILLDKLVEAGESREELKPKFDKLKRQRLRSSFLLASIEEDALEEGIVTAQGNIDWQAIGEFIKTIAPIILDLLEKFL